MDDNQTLSFCGHDIRVVVDERSARPLLSAVDVIAALETTENPSRYWSDFKRARASDDASFVAAIVTKKLTSTDGRTRQTDLLDCDGIQRMLERLKVKSALRFIEWMERTFPNCMARASLNEASIMPLTGTPYRPGFAFETAQSLPDENYRDIALAEWHYYRAEPEACSKLVEPLLAAKDPRLQLSANWLYGYANLSLGNIAQARSALATIHSRLDSLLQSQPEQCMRAQALFVATGASVLLHLPADTLDAMTESMACLPEGLRLFAAYILAHQAYLEGRHEQSLGIVEGVLSFAGNRHPVPCIYLHLIAVMDCMSLRKPEQAERHFDQAWELAMPDGMIEPFAEHHGLIQGMLEHRIKRDRADEFKRIIETTYRFAAGWRMVHNPSVNHEVADNLTTTQFSVAMLACRGWSNKEIAAYLGISGNTVKTYLSEVYGKLGIASRSELKRHMLA